METSLGPLPASGWVVREMKSGEMQCERPSHPVESLMGRMELLRTALGKNKYRMAWSEKV